MISLKLKIIKKVKITFLKTKHRKPIKVQNSYKYNAIIT